MNETYAVLYPIWWPTETEITQENNLKSLRLLSDLFVTIYWTELWHLDNRLTIEIFTLRHFWQNLAGSNNFCQIWQVNISVEKSNILEKSDRLEKSKDLDNSYFSYFSNIKYFSFHIFLIFPLNFNLKEENDPFCVTFWFLITNHLTFRMVNVSDQWNKSCARTFSFGFYLSKVQQIYFSQNLVC